MSRGFNVSEVVNLHTRKKLPKRVDQVRHMIMPRRPFGISAPQTN